MYSEGSEYLPQNNETALQYFKKASDLVRLNTNVFISVPTRWDLTFSVCIKVNHYGYYLRERSTLTASGEEQISVTAHNFSF